MLNPVRSVLEVAGCTAAGLAVAAMSGATSICGCPANCSPSPSICVHMNLCVTVPARAPDTDPVRDCAFEQCPGIEWVEGGPLVVRRTVVGYRECLTYSGVWIDGECVYDASQINPISRRWIQVVVGATTLPCPTPA